MVSRSSPQGAAIGAPTKRELNARLRSALFRRYDADDEFNRELAGLIPLAEAAVAAVGVVPGRSRIDLQWLAAPESHPIPKDVPAVSELRAAAEGLVSRFGLRRLGPDGLRYVLAWTDRFLSARRSSLAPATYGPGTLSTTRLDYVFEPEVVGVISAPWQREEWLPMTESRVSARKRLVARATREIDRALDAIHRESEMKELLAFPRHARNLERDVDWLYEKMRFSRSYQAIYNRLTPPPRGEVETVRKAVERMAKRLGVDTTGWESGWRI
jgi:hypothetical protein